MQEAPYILELFRVDADGNYISKAQWELFPDYAGDDRNPLIWMLLLGIGGCMAGAAWYLRKKDEKDQNQD